MLSGREVCFKCFDQSVELLMQKRNSNPMLIVACSTYDLWAEGLTVEQVTEVPQRGLVKRVSRMIVMG